MSLLLRLAMFSLEAGLKLIYPLHKQYETFNEHLAVTLTGVVLNYSPDICWDEREWGILENTDLW